MQKYAGSTATQGRLHRNRQPNPGNLIITCTADLERHL